MRIRFLRLAHGRDLEPPSRGSAMSAGWDVRAALDARLVLAPGERVAVPTGLAVELEPGWELQVRPRSGLARRHGVTLLNSPGTIDADFRGEIEVLLVNHGSQPFELRRGDRIAQLVPARVEPAVWEEVEALAPSSRGDGGFGSTGRS